MVIPKEEVLFKARPSSKEMSSCVGLVYFKSLVWLRILLFILWTRFTWWKKVNGNWDVINKNEHSLFHTSKPGNFNSLREVIFILTLLLPLSWLKRTASAKKMLRLLFTCWYGGIWSNSWSSWTSRHCCRNWSKNCSEASP